MARRSSPQRRASAQIHETAALGVDRAAAGDEVRDPLAHGAVGLQFGHPVLGEAAAQKEPVHRRRLGIGQRAEGDQFGPARGQRAQVVRIIEAEGGVPGDADAHQRCAAGAGRRPAPAEHWRRRRALGQREQPLQIEAARPPGARMRSIQASACVGLVARHQAQMALGDGEATHRAAGRPGPAGPCSAPRPGSGCGVAGRCRPC